MDVELVFAAASQAVDLARSGGGPSFLELRTYRYAGHHTGESTMGLSYRTQDEIERWRARDPVELAGARLESELRRQIDAEVDALLDEAVEFAEAGPWPQPGSVLADVYASGLRARAGWA